MIYLLPDDLSAIIPQNLLNASVQCDESRIDTIEKLVIDEVSAYLSPVYNVELVFDEEKPLINGLLKRIIAILTVYNVVARNAARKIPENFENMKEYAYDMLSKLANSELKLQNLPLNGQDEVQEDTSEEPNPTFSGSNRKEEYFY